LALVLSSEMSVNIYIVFIAQIAFMAHEAAPISVSSRSQPDNTFYCKTVDKGLVHRMVCLFTPQPLGRYQRILLGDRGTQE